MVVVLVKFLVLLDGLLLVSRLLSGDRFFSVRLASTRRAQAEYGDNLLEFAAMARRTFRFGWTSRQFQELECMVAFLAFIFKNRHNTLLMHSASGGTCGVPVLI